MLELTIHSVGRLTPTILSFLIAIHLWFRIPKDKATIWLASYFSFLFLFNLGYFLGYSISSEEAAYAWILACSICFASAARLQLSYHFAETIFKKESRWVLWISFSIACIALLDYLFNFQEGRKWLLPVHSYGSTYISILVPSISLLFYSGSLVVGIRKMFFFYSKSGFKQKGFQKFKGVWQGNISFRANFFLTSITVFEIGLNVLFLSAYAYWIGNSALAEWMNFGILLIFSAYALVYTLSPAGRTGFTPRLTGVALVFVLLLCGFPGRFYQEKDLDSFKSELDMRKPEIFSKNTYQGQPVFIPISEVEAFKPQFVGSYFDSRFNFLEFYSNPVFGFYSELDRGWKIYPYSKFRIRANESASLVSIWVLISVASCLLILPILFRASIILPLRQLKEDIERNSTGVISSSISGMDELESLRGSFREILSLLERAKQQMPEVGGEILNLKESIHLEPKRLEFGDRVLVYKSSLMSKLLEDVERAKNFKYPVLITGETGSGKELVARLLHGQENNLPFVAVNCASIPESLWESEIFGHKKGAFTDAYSDRAGKILEASGGTMFFDEIGEMPLSMQAKLLRVLQENQFTQVGSDKVLKADCRFIFATHRDLDKEVLKKRFREDLLYRIRVFYLRSPSLKERPEDIPYLIRYYLEKFSVEIGKPIPELDPKVFSLLMSYSWPGNIRELEHTILRSMVSDKEGVLDLTSFPEILKNSKFNAKKFTVDISKLQKIQLDDEIRYYTKSLVEEALRLFEGNKTKAAEYLGIKRTTLTYRIKELGISEEKS
ncbi:sigma-54 interaction domain-containing protein [Leptospira sarikeiensis]|uniref:Sigma-54-dependent Fis family transcriptional regulator n=1 Tax=Leptospira sarikeiensis TaxID=2484943 RepID=A0A4R9JYV5_9LEPT|nr:sigma-54 dependent transcriptional regulator [Leptospira sarikeiensis]TGL58440.1 sigma-54-dependent Fis family transcriptional regulator [Leptospira sarikeiensis]